MHIPGYRIIRKINQGGMSSVYLAIQLSVGREVALKVMSPALNSDPVFSERFQREANIVGQLSHPNIVSIYDIGRHKNLNYIAMDYLPGGSVQERMASGLSTTAVLRIMHEVAGALDHAHDKGYIHRDIKPENILFREDGSAVLSDFGVAKMVSNVSRMTNAGTVVGTPHYMSPEQTRGKPVDGRADIYSLGVVFYEMLTGQVPYQADEAVAIAIKHLTAPIPHLPTHYQHYQPLLDRLLAKDPDKRFQRGRDLRAALDELEGPEALSQAYLSSAGGSTRVQLLSLFRALLATAVHALREQGRHFWRSTVSLRWTPRRGLYRHPPTQVTHIEGPIPPRTDQYTTVVSTNVQVATHYYPVARRWRRSLSLIIVLLGIWSLFSVAMERQWLPGQDRLPASIAGATRETTRWLGASPPDEEATGASDPVAIQPSSQPLVLRPESTSAPGTDRNALPILWPELATDVAETENASDPSVPPRFELRVQPEPENAQVRIMNIAEPYYPGIPLLPGRYRIETRHAGYDTDSRWVEIIDEPTTLSVSLKKTPVAGATFHNALEDGGRGPDMVIVPAGRFTMGSKKDSRSMPERRVRIPRAFAISRYEITFADYSKFAQATDRPLPNDHRWGRDSRPVMNVSWNDANAYVQWLSEQTGKPYRLPSEAEWEYAARAGAESLYWWGNDEDSATGMANCRRGCDSDFTGLFSAKSAPVGTYPANEFGLHDTAGNVSEWTEDCYRNHLLEMPETGAPLIAEDCPERTVRGGSFADSATNIAAHIRSGQAPGYQDSTIGFRVVVELY